MPKPPERKLVVGSEYPSPDYFLKKIPEKERKPAPKVLLVKAPPEVKPLKLALRIRRYEGQGNVCNVWLTKIEGDTSSGLLVGTLPEGVAEALALTLGNQIPLHRITRETVNWSFVGDALERGLDETRRGVVPPR
jgi:hypothetical protein